MPPSLLDIDDLAQRLTLEEKVLLLSGVGKCRTRGLEHHSIPSIIVSPDSYVVKREERGRLSHTRHLTGLMACAQKSSLTQ